MKYLIIFLFNHALLFDYLSLKRLLLINIAFFLSSSCKKHLYSYNYIVNDFTYFVNKITFFDHSFFLGICFFDIPLLGIQVDKNLKDGYRQD